MDTNPKQPEEGETKRQLTEALKKNRENAKQFEGLLKGMVEQIQKLVAVGATKQVGNMKVDSLQISFDNNKKPQILLTFADVKTRDEFYNNLKP